MEVIVNVDEKGRVTIPKRVRKALKIGKRVRMRVEGKKLVIESLEPVSTRYYGILRAEVPENLDSVVIEAMAKWWKERTT